MKALVEAVQAHPRAAFAWLLVLHVLVWTALPAIFYPNLPLDIIEGLTYGREWQLGYDKLPPLPWWIIEALRLSFNTDVAYYAFAQLIIIVTFALVFATAQPVVGTLGALFSVLIIDGIHYFNYTSPKFNHDVIQLPFWALAGFSLRAALTHGRTLHWLLLGIALGGALWAKYFVVILAAPIALFLLADPQARRALATPGPYLAAAVALLIASPHLVWLVQHDFLPFRYADARSSESQGLIDHILHPLGFAGSQFLWLLPALFIALPLIVPPRNIRPPDVKNFEQRLVTLLAFGPAACLILLSALTGRGTIAMWGYPLWLFAGLWIVMVSRAALKEQVGRILAGWSLVALVYGTGFVVQNAVRPKLQPVKLATLYPGAPFAQELARRYREATGRPLEYLVADMWEGGNVAHYAANRPRVLIDGRPERAPWIDMDDLRRKGAVIIWETDFGKVQFPIRFTEMMKGAVIQPRFEVPYHVTDADLSIGWAILPPEK